MLQTPAWGWGWSCGETPRAVWPPRSCCCQVDQTKVSQSQVWRWKTSAAIKFNSIQVWREHGQEWSALHRSSWGCLIGGQLLLLCAPVMWTSECFCWNKFSSYFAVSFWFTCYLSIPLWTVSTLRFQIRSWERNTTCWDQDTHYSWSNTQLGLDHEFINLYWNF